jgi:hypothetical protein
MNGREPEVARRIQLLKAPRGSTTLDRNWQKPREEDTLRPVPLHVASILVKSAFPEILK